MGRYTKKNLAPDGMPGNNEMPQKDILQDRIHIVYPYELRLTFLLVIITNARNIPNIPRKSPNKIQPLPKVVWSHYEKQTGETQEDLLLQGAWCFACLLYSVSTKGAIVAFTRTVSLELAPKGIRVNAIAPGGVLVENWQKAMPEFDPSEFASKLPCGFIASPVDMGNIAVFLASDDARYILGQTILADGGQTAIMPLTDGTSLEDGVQFGKGYVTGLQTEIS